MLRSAAAALPLTRHVIRLLILMNLLWGIAILSLLVATLTAPGPVLSALGVHPATGNDQRILGMRMIMVLGVASVPLIHAALTRLGAMVETVQLGDPFVHENAVRLARIAWVRASPGVAAPGRGRGCRRGLVADSAAPDRVERFTHPLARRPAALRAGAGVRAGYCHARRARGGGLMAIIVKLEEILYARRITLTELSERIGITLPNLSVLKTGKARAVRFTTLDAICRALECQPGELLQYQPSPDADETNGEEPAAAAKERAA